MDTVESSGRLGDGALTLHLGVLVQPYRNKSRRATGLTTADVAQILEAKYGLFAAFFRVHERDVVNAVESSLQGALETLVQGRQATDPWDAGMKEIQQAFSDFVTSREAETVGIAGTPTQAALAGVNHRLKRPYRKRNPRRPSFFDTGLLVASMRSWVD